MLIGSKVKRRVMEKLTNMFAIQEKAEKVWYVDVNSQSTPIFSTRIDAENFIDNRLTNKEQYEVAQIEHIEEVKE
jgi:hypothetical protein